jgi:hypothetical protein
MSLLNPIENTVSPAAQKARQLRQSTVQIFNQTLRQWEQGINLLWDDANPQAVLDALEANGGSSVELFTRSKELAEFLVAQNPPAPELARINKAIAKVKPFTVVAGKILITVP